MIDAKYLDYIGLEFEEFGRGPDKFDCWGLVLHFFASNFSRELPGYEEAYVDTKDGAGIAGAFKTESEGWTRVDTPREGDCIVFNIGGFPSHIGIVVRPGLMLHIEKGKNSCIEKYDQKKWRNRIEGFYRR